MVGIKCRYLESFSLIGRFYQKLCNGVLKSRKSSHFARAMAARAKMLTKVVKFDRYFSEISSSGVTLISTNTQLGEIGFLLKCCQDLSPCSY